MAAATPPGPRSTTADDRAGGAGLTPAPVPRRLELHRAAAASRSRPARAGGHAQPRRPGHRRPGLPRADRDYPPGPGRPGRCLQIPFNAAREQRLYAGRGGPAASRAGPPRVPRHARPRRRLLATVLTQRLSVPQRVLAAIFGVHQSTISHAVTITRWLLTSRGITIEPHRPGSAPLPTSATTPATPESTSPPPPTNGLIICDYLTTSMSHRRGYPGVPEGTRDG